MDNSTASKPKLDKLYFENTWTDKLALANLSPDQLLSWQRFKHVERIYMNIHGRIAHWQRQSGAPTKLSSLQLDTVSVVPTGITYSFAAENRKVYKVTRIPTLLEDINVFAWVPHFNEMRCAPWVWTDALSVPATRVAIATRQISDPSKVTLDGHDYLTTTQNFGRLWAKKQDNRS